MEGSSASTARFTRPAEFLGVELASVVYRQRVFPRHSHPEYVIGAVVRGAETLEVGGVTHLAAAGSALMLRPDEAHANASVGPEPLSYRVIYLAPAVVADWRPEGLAFANPVSRDPGMVRRIVAAHAAFEGGASRLEMQEALGVLLLGCPSAGAEPATPGPSGGVNCAKAFIDACFADDFDLAHLAEVSGLSRFHLVRSFKRATGLTPAAYRNQRRIEAARGLLHSRASIAEIALEVGFADQAHLTRHFQRLVGVSPARYRAQ